MAGLPSSYSLLDQLPVGLTPLYSLQFRRGSRINADRFPQQAPKTQASWGVQGHAPPVNVLDFNSLKSPFSGFRVTQIGYWPVPFTLDKALQLGKFFIY